MSVRDAGVILLTFLTSLAIAAAAGCGGPNTLSARMQHAENQGRAAEELLDEADKRLDALEAERAAKLIADAKEKLADKDIAKYPEHALLRDRAKKSEERLEKVREELAKRELERAVLEQKQLVETAATRLEKAMDGVRHPEVSDSRLREARDAADDLRDKLANGEKLEAKDKALRDYAAGVRKALEKAIADTARGERGVKFRDGPGLAQKEALALVDQATAEKDRAHQRELFGTALDRFKRCAASGREMLGATPELAKLKIELDGKTTSPEAVTALCERSAEQLDKRLAKSVAKTQAKAAKAVEDGGKKKSKPKKK